MCLYIMHTFYLAFRSSITWHYIFFFFFIQILHALWHFCVIEIPAQNIVDSPCSFYPKNTISLSFSSHKHLVIWKVWFCFYLGSLKKLQITVQQAFQLSGKPLIQNIFKRKKNFCVLEKNKNNSNFPRIKTHKSVTKGEIILLLLHVFLHLNTKNWILVFYLRHALSLTTEMAIVTVCSD